jgi:hypothetical protein
VPGGETRSAVTGSPQPPGAVLAGAVRDGVGELDRRLQSASRGLLTLGGLLPLALLTWALTELARGRLSPLPWSSALWYAHSLFRDYASPAARE